MYTAVFSRRNTDLLRENLREVGGVFESALRGNIRYPSIAPAKQQLCLDKALLVSELYYRSSRFLFEYVVNIIRTVIKLKRYFLGAFIARKVLHYVDANGIHRVSLIGIGADRGRPDE